MLTSTIVQIVMRMFGLSWIVQALISFATFLASLSVMGDLEGGSKTLYMLSQILPGVLLLILGLLGWFLAPCISRMIVGQQEATVNLPSLTLHDLYSFALVFLGMYFLISSLGNLLNWLFYLFRESAAPEYFGENRQPPDYYGLINYLITCAVGLICIVKRNTWAEKLARA
ncbi:MAG TPA: hypothetical protein VHC95_03565 [Opitutales bacterium]|nr:hypothetical protein [Opitutales bacterium]